MQTIKIQVQFQNNLQSQFGLTEKKYLMPNQLN